MSAFKCSECGEYMAEPYSRVRESGQTFIFCQECAGVGSRSEALDYLEEMRVMRLISESESV